MAQAVYEDLVFYDFEADDAADVIRKLGVKLEKKGFVKDTYTEAVAAREEEYPTGLNLDGRFGGDAAYVRHPCDQTGGACRKTEKAGHIPPHGGFGYPGKCGVHLYDGHP